MRADRDGPRGAAAASRVRGVGGSRDGLSMCDFHSDVAADVGTGGEARGGRGGARCEGRHGVEGANGTAAVRRFARAMLG